MQFVLHSVIRFQSLFSWMSLWNSKIPAYPLVIDMFQSLFSWMSLWNTISVSLMIANGSVSILVFVDVALELLHFWGVAVQGLARVSILVFVDVALER